jgi:hypothetical protein
MEIPLRRLYLQLIIPYHGENYIGLDIRNQENPQEINQELIGKNFMYRWITC